MRSSWLLLFASCVLGCGGTVQGGTGGSGGSGGSGGTGGDLLPGECRTVADCVSEPSCAPPGSPQCGPPPQLLCAADADCAADGLVCLDTPCGGTECGPGCTSDADCLPEEECDLGSAHCQARTCAGAADCPSNFSCGAAACERLLCATDAACDLGYCVDGACYAEPGTCTLPGA